MYRNFRVLSYFLPWPRSNSKFCAHGICHGVFLHLRGPVQLQGVQHDTIPVPFLRLENCGAFFIPWRILGELAYLLANGYDPSSSISSSAMSWSYLMCRQKKKIFCRALCGILLELNIGGGKLPRGFGGLDQPPSFLHGAYCPCFCFPSAANFLPLSQTI